MRRLNWNDLDQKARIAALERPAQMAAGDITASVTAVKNAV